MLIAGASARLVRLTAADTVTAPLRTWAQGRIAFNRQQRAALTRGEPAPDPTRPWAVALRGWLGELSTCEWCLGVWWSFAVAIADAHCHRPGRPRRSSVFEVTTAALAAAYIVGLLAEHEKPVPAVLLTAPEPVDPRTEEGPAPR